MFAYISAEGESRIAVKAQPLLDSQHRHTLQRIGAILPVPRHLSNWRRRPYESLLDSSRAVWRRGFDQLHGICLIIVVVKVLHLSQVLNSLKSYNNRPVSPPIFENPFLVAIEARDQFRPSDIHVLMPECGCVLP